MLKALFEWLDGHYDSYWILAFGPTLLLGAVICGALRGETSVGPAPKRGIHRWDALVLFVFLFAWRWPFLLIATELNPDESQFISGAITLAHDPVFWRSVDGSTSGPLNFYVLLPLHWLGLSLDYFTARLIGLLLVGGALYCCHLALARHFGRAAAWVGLLPAVMFFATTTHPDLIHYSSEHLPLFLIGVAIWLLASRAEGDRVRLWIACLSAGAAPWAKLQAAPLSLVLIGWGVWQVWRESPADRSGRLFRLIGVGLAAAGPTLLIVSIIFATGQAETAMRRYGLHNISYVGSARPLMGVLREMVHLAYLEGQLALLILTGVAMLLSALAFLVIRRVRPPAILVVGGLLTMAAVLAILAPRREFLHYGLLLPVPFTLFIGAAIGVWLGQIETARVRLCLAGALLLAGGLLPITIRARQPVPNAFGQFAYDWRHPSTQTAMIARALSGKNDSLGVWGWACNLHVETGLRQATRDSNTNWAILPNTQRDYFRAFYLSDLERTRPAVFVDAVGPGAFAFDTRLAQGHEIFPELKEFIRRNYSLVTDLGTARVFARNDLATLKALDQSQLKQILAQGRPFRLAGTPPPITPADMLVKKNIHLRQVLFLAAPSRVEWPLDAEVREVAIEYGFDPTAYAQGGSNGAELVMELANETAIWPVYRCMLDPMRRPGDRGPQAALVTLPPFPAGTRLVVRTDPGEFGDNAWDWVYLGDLQLRRSVNFIAKQFPGFNRIPDRADGVNTAFFEEAGRRCLQLHAPGSVAYLLKGDERELRFEYGFRPGAYSQGGRTDGAVFRVELKHAGQPDRILFERRLQPVERESDQGNQQIDLLLPALVHGDQLTLRIDPGPAGNISWDWTYITNLILQ